MKVVKLIIFILFIIGISSTSYTKLIDLTLELEPTSEGQLGGYVMMDINWWKYLSSSFQYSSQSYNIFNSNQTDTKNVQNIEKNYVFYFLQTRNVIQDLLNVDWFSLNLGLVGKIADIDEYEYGMIYSSNSYVFFQDYTRTKYFKPLINFNLDINFSFIDIYSSFLFTPVQVNENYSGYLANSVTETKTEYQNQDKGYEYELYVLLTTEIKEVLDISLGFEYFTHIGYTSGRENNQRVDFLYSRTDISYSVLFGLKFIKNALDIMDITPVVGVTYLSHTFEPLSNPNIDSRSDSRWKFNIGFEL